MGHFPGRRILRPPSDDGGRFRIVATCLLLAVAAGGVVDLVLDRPTTWRDIHLLFEVGLLMLTLGAIAYFWLGWEDAGLEVARTRAELRSRGAERDAWRHRAEKLLLGLGQEIDAQLREWDLTPVERETALLLLKGLGHKEIAAVQGKSERTVRQHAVSVYRKSGLAGRAELSAFFLEDLLLPVEETDPLIGRQ